MSQLREEVSIFVWASTMAIGSVCPNVSRLSYGQEMNDEVIVGGGKGGRWLSRGLLNGAAQKRRGGKAMEGVAAIYGGSRSSWLGLV